MNCKTQEIQKKINKNNFCIGTLHKKLTLRTISLLTYSKLNNKKHYFNQFPWSNEICWERIDILILQLIAKIQEGQGQKIYSI